MSKWDRAACIGHDTRIFFDHEDERGQRRANALAAARLMCQGCPIKQACLQFALDSNEQFGVWGGLTAAERSELLSAPGAHRAAS